MKTPAIAFLEQQQIPFTTHSFEYKEKGGTAHSSQTLGVDEYQVIKTLIFKTNESQAIIVLMHGNCQVDTKALAQQIGCKKISSTSPETALKLTGYQVGGISPFGTKTQLPVYAEESILSLDTLLINGGARGFLVKISGKDLQKLVNPKPVKAGIQK